MRATVSGERAWSLALFVTGAALTASLAQACDRKPSAAADAALDAEPADAARRSVGRPSLSSPPADASDGGLLGRKLPRIEYRGGPFLRHPRIITVTFAKDDAKLVARLEELGASITRTSWWKTVTEGYCASVGDCIGEGAATNVHLDALTDKAIKDTAVDALLARAAKEKKLGVLDESTLLVVYLPQGATLEDATVKAYCAEGAPRAFHRAIDLEGRRLALAVVPRCGDEALTTGTASHEILEATTNPFPAERGFAFVTGSGPSGFSAAGLEPVDPCGLVTMDKHSVVEGAFTFQRAWSNRAAALGLEPCVPAPRPDEPYVMLVPREPAVRVAREGASVTVDLDATAARDTAPWDITAFDLTGRQDHETYLEVTLDKTRVQRGDAARLTLAFRKRPPAGRAVVALLSTLDGAPHMWPLAVTMR